MIEGICKTNLDDYDVSIVKSFVAVPIHGHNVNVLYNGRPTTLKVVAITHATKKVDGFVHPQPYIIVELNK